MSRWEEPVGIFFGSSTWSHLNSQVGRAIYFGGSLIFSRHHLRFRHQLFSLLGKLWKRESSRRLLTRAVL